VRECGNSADNLGAEDRADLKNDPRRGQSEMPPSSRQGKRWIARHRLVSVVAPIGRRHVVAGQRFRSRTTKRRAAGRTTRIDGRPRGLSPRISGETPSQLWLD